MDIAPTTAPATNAPAAGHTPARDGGAESFDAVLRRVAEPAAAGAAELAVGGAATALTEVSKPAVGAAELGVGEWAAAPTEVPALDVSAALGAEPPATTPATTDAAVAVVPETPVPAPDALVPAGDAASSLADAPAAAPALPAPAQPVATAEVGQVAVRAEVIGRSTADRIERRAPKAASAGASDPLVETSQPSAPDDEVAPTVPAWPVAGRTEGEAAGLVVLPAAQAPETVSLAPSAGVAPSTAGVNPAAAALPAAAPRDPAAVAVPPPPPPVRQVGPIAIALAVGPGARPRLTVALEPAELGRVEIRVERAVDGEAAAIQIIAERPETLALLQRDARELNRALDQAGVGTSDRRLSFDLAGQEGHGRGEGERSAGGGGRRSGTGAGPAAPLAQTQALGLLDIAV